MQVAITSRHGNLSDNTTKYITEKSEKLLTYFERVTAIHVTVDFGNGGAKVELLVDAEHRHSLVSHHAGEDVPSTFDQALHKMEQQIRKYKQKLQDHRRNVPFNQLVQTELPAEESSEESESQEDED